MTSKEAKDRTRAGWVSQNLRGMLNGRGARGTNDGRGIEPAFEVLERLLPDNPCLYVELNFPGRLQARQMPTLADIANSGIIAGVLVPRQDRGSSDHQNSANREQRDGLPD